jgi:hypothetical protein
MSRLTRAAIAAAGIAVVAAPAPAAEAATIVVPECGRAVPAEKTIPIQGTGFRPGGFVRIVDAAGQTLGSTTADAAGNFNDVFFGPTFPSSDTNQVNLTVSAIDDQNVASPPVPLPVVRVTADLPDRARPTSRVRYRVFGFETGRRVYLHIRRGGKTQGTFRISNANGPCGIASRRMRYMPLRTYRTGVYDYYFQHTPRFDRSQPGVKLSISITRRIRSR